MKATTSLPFNVCLNLRLLVEFWERQAEDPDGAAAPAARAILEALDEAPLLREPIEDVEALEPHAGLIARMMTAMIPPGRTDDFYGAAVIPFRLYPFYQTDAAARLGLFDVDRFEERLNISPELLRLGKAMAAYEYILHHWVGVEADFQYSMILSVDDEDSGIQRHFNLRFDPRFIALSVDPELDKPSRADLERLIAEPTNLALWTEVLPPEAFSFEGLTFVSAEDVTAQEVISRLKNDLIDKDAMSSSEKIDHLRTRLRALLRSPELEVGVIGFDHGENLSEIERARAIGRSLLLCDEHAPDCPNRAESFYASAFHGEEPVIVYDLERSVRSGYEHHLLAHGHRNLLVCPLRDGDRLVGILELASPVPGDLNAFNALMLSDVVPLFASALKRVLEERDDRVQAVIKEQYTAIHPSVEWRFREAAITRLHAIEEHGESPEPEPIVFPDVYPLYGLADIRGSSDLRGAAIRDDLLTQLGLAADVINAAGQVHPLPALEEVGFRVSRYREQLESGLRSDEESKVLEFLRRDVESLFGKLEGFGPEALQAVRDYRDALDPDLAVVYRRRREFEESVSLLNETISRTLAVEQARAQKIFPHYFERFQTDGVDYSMYVGASIVRDGRFDPLYLRSLRIWQLMLTARVDWELQRALARAPTDLDVTHLILVQDQPLSIRFRIEEKQFDVDGAYNIRYEIVKKRIDKARVRGSSERVTQPGRLAIVYSTAREAREYERYLEFLGSRGFFEGRVEHLDVEDLQGVYGLRALRVAIADPPEVEGDDERAVDTAALRSLASAEVPSD